MTSTRRFALKLGVAVIALLRRRDGAAADTGPPRIGAIRWDAWYGGVDGKDNSRYAAHNLDPARYHSRAPWFAIERGPDLMSIDGNQASMDQEIKYASTAGLAYWAFCRYEPSSAFTNGWRLFQQSRTKNTINWCWIYSYGRFHQDVTERLAQLVEQCSQENYERVAGDRPMIYLMADGGATTAQVAADVETLRRASRAASLGSPYVVTMNGSVERARAAHAATGADAISSYGFARPTDHGTYVSLDRATRLFWAELSSSGLPLVPCGVTGWDRRPRIEHPVPWERPAQEPGVGMENSFATALPSEIAAHVRALIAFVEANPATCRVRGGLVYAWDEFDEGGWLCPTWTRNGPDDARLRAIHDILR